jgi:hypothetical protein
LELSEYKKEEILYGKLMIIQIMVPESTVIPDLKVLQRKEYLVVLLNHHLSAFGSNHKNIIHALASIKNMRIYIYFVKMLKM